MAARTYFVYILTNAKHTVLYTGVTSDLMRRIAAHQAGRGGEFTKRYGVYKLVYFESGTDAAAAIAREKQIKAGSRAKKIALIEAANPEWKDLCEGLP